MGIIGDKLQGTGDFKDYLLEKLDFLAHSMTYRGATKFEDGDGKRDFRDGYSTAVKDLAFDLYEHKDATAGGAFEDKLFEIIRFLDEQRIKEGIV